jgi:fructokinase
MARRSDRIIGIGEVLWDLFPDGKRLGGAPANCAYHAQALGARGIVVSAVGEDKLGREILARFDEVGLDRRFIHVDTQHPTGRVTVTLDEHGRPDFVIHEEVAWDYISFTEALRELARQADAVCTGSLGQRSAVSRETVRRFLGGTRLDCLRVFDINLRQSFYGAEMVADMLELSNVLKLNDEELRTLAELLGIKGPEPDVLQELIGRYDLDLVALTMGSRGSRLTTRHDEASHPGFAVEVVDTVGAGDAFTAALILGLLRGDDLDEINEHANRLASYVCTQRGAMPEIPDRLRFAAPEAKS